MTVINRKDIRSALATALTTNITAAKYVADYLADPQGQMPAVTLTSVGSGGNPLTSDGDTLQHKILIHLLVIAGKSASWTNENAEDLLDDIRAALDTYIEGNSLTVSGKLYTIERLGDSDISRVAIGNEQYLDETVPILLRTFYP